LYLPFSKKLTLLQVKVNDALAIAGLSSSIGGTKGEIEFFCIKLDQFAAVVGEFIWNNSGPL